jgi:mannose-6-phosphate isomerase-like protein (cupin superfamily)
VEEKGWGSERIVYKDEKLCTKIITIKHGGKSSLHFHVDKREVFLIIQGILLFIWVEPETAEEHSMILHVGDSVYVPKYLSHQFACSSPDKCVFIENSTEDNATDSYRVRPGDSQTKK